jgi:drug/metabolite transporter (DMT)-like permease
VNLAIPFGLAAALFITGSLMASSRSVRLIGNFPALAWVALIGLVITLPWAIVTGIPANLGTEQVVLLALIGVTGLGGFLFSFAAFRFGKVGVVAPILATEGAVAAVLAASFGEQLAIGAAVMLLVSVVGVIVAGIARDPFPIAHERPLAAIALAVGAAISWGVGLYLIGRLGQELPIAWVVLPPRLIGVICLTIPLALLGRLRLTRKAAPLVTLAALCEVSLNACIGLGSRSSIAITSVLAAQYAVLTPLAAWLIFRESLGRLQIVGIALLVAGVTGLAVFSR